MKKFFNKTISLALSLIVLFSTVSFTVDKHFCGEHLMDVAVFSAAENCGMEMIQKTSHEVQVKKKSCCRNEFQIVEGNSLEQQAIQKMEFPQLYFVVAFISLFTESFDNSIEQSYCYYDPPLVKKDITVLFENFRI
ncbi:HYC_CC_PP family protein [Urechidicola croceus]|uniref:Secreted protein n=1 Tax=Urechidicola croceus TaxID=1850246 RepID=A0A1D8PAQ3_9FLAO|nr:hypothetical protein [Urechidicola croceus]AOW21663.1 hypothetical protein LPB138_13670 [Urechidicola croceus]